MKPSEILRKMELKNTIVIPEGATLEEIRVILRPHLRRMKREFLSDEELSDLIESLIEDSKKKEG